MESDKYSFFKIWCWIATLLVWGSSLLALNHVINGPKLDNEFFVIFVVTLIIYFVTELVSSDFRYLLSTTTCADIYDYMGKLFYTPLNKSMKISCYHNRSKEVKETSPRSGKVHSRTVTERVHTSSNSSMFRYVSWRDISGQFVVNTEGAAANEERAFVRLRLRLKMEFANDGTAADFEQQKADFIAINKRDVMFDYDEELVMQGYEEYNLVKISDAHPKAFGCGWFLFFTLLTFAEFYKMYMEKFCSDQEFTIIKMVSSRQNLNTPQMIRNYEQMGPSVAYKEHVVYYNGPMILPENMWGAPVSQGIPGSDVNDPLIKR
eukprot:TRINITY_DN759_c0_g1_i6.p1 TRINITY_DN759_c0_g1~~TRINITY_DN759_c0_g1_i6.p1  ORF type:complete len:320 (+),score=55.49 TRINITY_DN759_c0_g1_i6:156-1115(+)